jgi:predicted RNase H-like nuclease
VRHGGEEARGVVREAHPELCFWALNNGETVESKKQTREGYEERLRILGEQSPEVRKAAEAATERFATRDRLTCGAV